MWPFRKSELARDPILDDFDSDQFIQKMKGNNIPRIVDFNKRYKLSDASRMAKTGLIALEILAERLNKMKS